VRARARAFNHLVGVGKCVGRNHSGGRRLNLLNRLFSLASIFPEERLLPRVEDGFPAAMLGRLCLALGKGRVHAIFDGDPDRVVVCLHHLDLSVGCNSEHGVLCRVKLLHPPVSVAGKGNSEGILRHLVAVFESDWLIKRCVASGRRGLVCSHSRIS